MKDPYPALLVRVRQYLPFFARSALLLALSIAFLPLDTVLLVRFLWLEAFRELVPRVERTPHAVLRRWHIRFGIFVHDGRTIRHPNHKFEPRTILITGAGTARGLALARHFHAAGHNVVGADSESLWLPISPARVSRAVQRFHTLPKLNSTHDAFLVYIEKVCRIARRAGADLFVPCGAETTEEHRANALIKEILDRQSGRNCETVQLGSSMTTRFLDEDALREYVWNIDLPVATNETFTSVDAALRYLEKDGKRHEYILFPSDAENITMQGNLAIVSLESTSRTRSCLVAAGISPEKPFTLRQHVPGPKYTAHCLIIKGVVRTFAALAATTDDLYLQQLPAQCGLSTSMLRYAQEFASASQQVLRSSQSDFTGHVSFTFAVRPEDAKPAMEDSSVIVRLYAVACTPGVTNAVLLFHDEDKLADVYLSVLHRDGNKRDAARAPVAPNGTACAPLMPHTQDGTVSWTIQHLLMSVLVPMTSLLVPIKSGVFREFLHNVIEFVARTQRFGWKDASFVDWDPIPAFWLYHVCMPIQLCIALLRRRRWDMIDVSTCRIFEKAIQDAQ